MRYFIKKRPRGFHHKYIYVDERKDKLKGIEARAKAELEKKESPRQYAGRENNFQINFRSCRTKRAGKYKSLYLSLSIVVALAGMMIVILAFTFLRLMQ